MSKMVKVVEGDLLKAKVDIIAHQVNCQSVMGSGLALAIKTRYPEAFTGYISLCAKNSAHNLLGVCQMVNCTDGNYVANLFGQLNYGRDKQHTDYVALESALQVLYVNAKEHNLSVGIPYLLGCGLGGGNWNVVYDIINKVFDGYENVTIYKLI